MGAKKSAILTAACLAAMLAALLITVWIFTTYQVYGNAVGRGATPFSVTLVGIYVFIFLLANTSLSTAPFRRGLLVTAPTAFLAGWAIVAGPFYGWLGDAGLAIVVAIVFVFGPALAFYLLIFVGLVIVPFGMGCLAGLLVHFAARILAGEPPWNRLARREAFAHCVGFTIGAYIVFLANDAIDDQLTLLQDEGASPLGFIALLWPIYLGAPAGHLICLWAARYRWGWPAGELRVKRTAVVCLLLFLSIGTARGIASEDPAMLLAWPAQDFSEIDFWRNYPRRDEPFAIGDHRILLDEGRNPGRKWNRDLQQYDYFHFRVSEAAWPFTDVRPTHVEIRLREAHPPYVPVKCDEPGPHGLVLCQPVQPQDTASPADRSVPAYWLRYDHDIYGVPTRSDMVLAQRFDGERDEHSLSVALSGSHYPKVSVLIGLYKFDLSRWKEAAAALDQIVAHHLKREGSS